MKYELAKELKDAGFPQGGDVRPAAAGWGGAGSDVINPTLSELIEAIGEGAGLRNNGIDRWTAFKSIEDKLHVAENGKTPEEAVAKLWIEINK